jgi:prepilin-type processing-associated H-X9-DG protein
MPYAYACPADSNLAPGTTSYLAIGGFTGPVAGPTPPLLPPAPGGATPPYNAPGESVNMSSQTSLSNIVDGTSNTILVVEAAGSRVNWMEPVDLDLRGNYTMSNLADGQHIASEHMGGVNVAMCDAAVMTLPTTTDAETLQRLIMKDDGMVVTFP